MKHYLVNDFHNDTVGVDADHFSVSKEGIALFYRATGPVRPGGERADKLIAASSTWGNVRLAEDVLIGSAVIGDLSEELLTKLGLGDHADDAKIKISVVLDKE